ncbi:MAG TPA: ABC transporter ATP-binding protein [Pirellulales bacterium]|nr:ABC transporter ATP-binding protein [Pirellulales bacterium]
MANALIVDQREDRHEPAPLATCPRQNCMTTSDAPRDELLRCDKVAKIYPDGQVAALADIDLSIHGGEFVAIMGPSGSGKSTLLQILGLLDTPTTGELHFEGLPTSRLRHTDRVRAAKIGFVFQSFHLLPMLTALENVQVPMFESELPAQQRAAKAAELLDRAGIGHRARHLPQRMSVGERQRVAIARSLANDPVLLLADEPTGALDTKTGEDIMDLFVDLHRRQQMTIVVVTHDSRVAERAERLIHICDGRMVSDERRS